MTTDITVKPPEAADLFQPASINLFGRIRLNRAAVLADGPPSEDTIHDRWLARKNDAEKEALDALAFAINRLRVVHSLPNTLGPSGALARLVKLAEADATIEEAQRASAEEEKAAKEARK